MSNKRLDILHKLILVVLIIQASLLTLLFVSPVVGFEPSKEFRKLLKLPEDESYDVDALLPELSPEYRYYEGSHRLPEFGFFYCDVYYSVYKSLYKREYIYDLILATISSFSIGVPLIVIALFIGGCIRARHLKKTRTINYFVLMPTLIFNSLWGIVCGMFYSSYHATGLYMVLLGLIPALATIVITFTKKRNLKQQSGQSKALKRRINSTVTTSAQLI